MNTIVNDLFEQRKGMYVHALEVETVYELESIVESLCVEWRDKYTKAQILEFFNSVSLYALNEENEESVYAFNFEEYINELV